jgi:hypothetical protein
MPTNSPAITKQTPNIAKHPFITATGAKGYLQWLASDPVMAKVYAQIRPQIEALISAGQLPLGTGSGASAAPGNLGAYMQPGMSGLGQCCSFAWCSAFCTAIGNSSCTSAAVSDIVTNSAPTSGSTSSSWLSTLTNLVSVAGQTALTASQISTANQANSIQLARAKSGQSPLNLSAYGISTVPGLNLGLSGSTLGTIVLVAGLGLLAVVVLKKKH